MEDYNYYIALPEEVEINPDKVRTITSKLYDGDDPEDYIVIPEGKIEEGEGTMEIIENKLTCHERQNGLEYIAAYASPLRLLGYLGVGYKCYEIEPYHYCCGGLGLSSEGIGVHDVKILKEITLNDLPLVQKEYELKHLANQEEIKKEEEAKALKEKLQEERGKYYTLTTVNSPEEVAINNMWYSQATALFSNSMAITNEFFSIANTLGDNSMALANENASVAITMGDGSYSQTKAKGVACGLGDNNIACTTGADSLAVVWNPSGKGKAKGVKGSYILLTDKSLGGNFTAKLGYIDGEKLKADTYYILYNGDFIEADNLPVDYKEIIRQKAAKDYINKNKQSKSSND